MPGKKGMKHYPISIKEKAIRMHLEEGITTTDIMKILGVNDGRCVRKWCETYRKYGVAELPTSRQKGRPRKHERTTQEKINYEIKQLKMENELLRNFLFEVARR